MKLVECVPNFSEGRDREKINAITREIENTPGVTLLDVDPGESTNRTVVTFIGTPEAAQEAAFKAIKKAAEVIDMRQHQGAHSRVGATDVCPFVPVTGVTMEDCVRIAHQLGGWENTKVFPKNLRTRNGLRIMVSHSSIPKPGQR